MGHRQALTFVLAADIRKHECRLQAADTFSYVGSSLPFDVRFGSIVLKKSATRCAMGLMACQPRSLIDRALAVNAPLAVPAQR
jgi:hypothetical protein